MSTPPIESKARDAKPPDRIPLWPLLVAIVLGVFVGIGAYTFSYAKGLSYLSTDPRACTNCHIMQREYDGWEKASHHTVAVCVDCHLPQGFISKYLTKAENGWRHGKLFTTGGFDEPIEVKPAGRRILEQNCVRCHDALTADLRSHGAPGASAAQDQVACLHCHAGVGHGERAGLGGPASDTPTRENTP